MADFTVGSAAAPGNNCQYEVGIAGAALAVNKIVYLDTSQSPAKWELADADSAITATTRLGWVINAASAENERVIVAYEGEVNVSGASGTVAVAGYVSTTAGGLAPVADLASGDYVAYMGMWRTATIFSLNPHCAGVALA